MAQSTIEWTEMTWNPVTGCKKVSQGCKHCYAERMANRLRAFQILTKRAYRLRQLAGELPWPETCGWV